MSSQTNCRVCGEEVLVMKTVTSKRLTLNADPDPQGTVTIVFTGNAFGGDIAVQLRQTFTDREMYAIHECSAL